MTLSVVPRVSRLPFPGPLERRWRDTTKLFTWKAFLQPGKILAFRWKHYLPLCENTEQFFGFPWSFASKVQGQCRNTDNNGRDNTCRLHVGIPEMKIKNIINLKRLHTKKISPSTSWDKGYKNGKTLSRPIQAPSWFSPNIVIDGKVSPV